MRISEQISSPLTVPPSVLDAIREHAITNYLEEASGLIVGVMLAGVMAQGRHGMVFRGARVDEAFVERVQAALRQREAGLFEWSGLLSSETVAAMQGWGHRVGFSVDAGERVAAQSSAGCERLLRYCAQPMFAAERLVWAGEGAGALADVSPAWLDQHLCTADCAGILYRTFL